jgi:hypothetical protein
MNTPVNPSLGAFSAADQSPTHLGVQRIQEGLAAVRDLAHEAKKKNRANGLAMALLGGVVAALVVLADRMVDAWADEHVFAAWVLMWALVFGALGLFSGLALRSARALIASFKMWHQRNAQARADANLWRIAQRDPRVMAEIRMAQSLAQDAALADDATAQAKQTSAAINALAYSAYSANSATTERNDNFDEAIEANRRRRSYSVA